MALYSMQAGDAIEIVSTPHPTDSALFSGEWDLLIIDRFPLFVLDQSDRWLHDMLLRLAVMARTGKTIVLLMDLGVLNSGRKIVEGPPKEVVANPEVIRAYLGERYNAAVRK